MNKFNQISNNLFLYFILCIIIGGDQGECMSLLSFNAHKQNIR